MKKVFILFILLCAVLNGSFASASEEAFVYDEHNKRDPLWRLVTRDGVIVNYDQDLLITDMLLEGIIYDPSGKSLAIINGSVVKKYDKIGLFVVEKVDKKKVILRKGQESYALELKEED